MVCTYVQHSSDLLKCMCNILFFDFRMMRFVTDNQPRSMCNRATVSAAGSTRAPANHRYNVNVIVIVIVINVSHNDLSKPVRAKKKRSQTAHNLRKSSGIMAVVSLRSTSIEPFCESSGLTLQCRTALFHVEYIPQMQKYILHICFRQLKINYAVYE